VSASLDRQPDEVSALARRRQLRELSTQERDIESGHEADDASVKEHPRDPDSTIHSPSVARARAVSTALVRESKMVARGSSGECLRIHP